MNLLSNSLPARVMGLKHISTKSTLRQKKLPAIASTKSHTMGDSLPQYLRIKVHPNIAGQDWDAITIKPSHLRSPSVTVGANEKTGKLFNWQRPTALLDEKHRKLELHCFPGRDYVYHYASIIATYLSLQGKDPSVVDYVEPRPEDCMEPLLNSNLRKLGPVDTVVVGFVHGLPSLREGPWHDGDATDELFAWKVRQLPSGRKVAFLGCRVSFWGSIAGSLVRALQQLCQVRCVLYIGKLGSLKPEHIPNRFLATGNSSSVEGAILEWDNPLALAAEQTDDPYVTQGRHYTLPSVLDESHDWFAKHQPTFHWVEPEIGHMALASVAGGTDFGYLHIVSDNLAKHYRYDLSNERLQQVLEDRRVIALKIEHVLNKYLQEK